MPPETSVAAAKLPASRHSASAQEALETALSVGLQAYDRSAALARFHRLSPGVIEAETLEASRQILAEIERALRAERARIGHWSYDLNRHISLLTAYRAETARRSRLSARARSAGRI